MFTRRSRVDVPLRLTVNDTTLTGHVYDDVLGVRYEFPPRYRNLVRRGERFVYYRGRRRAAGGTQRQVYLGTGIVGDVHPSLRSPERLACEIEDWHPFAEPLPFKDPAGNYYEPGGKRGGFYWQEGVRRIDEEVYQSIVNDALTSEPMSPPRDMTSAQGRTTVTAPGAYASAEVVRAVDAYAMTAALAELARRWPDSIIERQRPNNPGFDVRIGPTIPALRYVEVKGTTLSYPRFFLSEGERAFSQCAADQYTLVVIYAIDLRNQIHKVFWHDGAVSDDSFVVTPRQWVCEIRQRG
jgi:Protein NO VEIN, C-terminal